MAKILKFNFHACELFLWPLAEKHYILSNMEINPQAKQGEGVEKYQFKPFQILFFSGFYIKIMFWVRWFYSLFERMRLKRKRTMFIHTNLPLISWFYIKRYLFFAELAMSQRWSAVFCATGAWGGIPIGRLRFKVPHIEIRKLFNKLSNYCRHVIRWDS